MGNGGSSTPVSDAPITARGEAYIGRRMQGGGVSLMSYQVHADGLTYLAKDDGKVFKSFSAPQVNLVSAVGLPSPG